MEIRITYWKHADGRSGQEGEKDYTGRPVIEHQKILTRVSPSFLAGLTACPYGQWSVDDADSVLKLEIRQDNNWVKMDNYNLYDTYLEHLRQEEGSDEAPGDLLVTYGGDDALYRGTDEEFIKGLEYFRDHVDSQVEFQTITEYARFLTPAEEYEQAVGQLLVDTEDQ